MKKIALILSAVGMILMAASCKTGNNAAASSESSAAGEGPAAGAIVYFNLDRVLDEYDMANDLRSVVETKVGSIQQEINRRGSKLEKDVKAFQDKIDKGLLTRSVAEVQGQKLQQQYAMRKQQEMAEEQQVMLNQIADAIKSFLDEYNAEKKYAMIISTQGSVLPAPVACADPELDITDEILEGLNAAYVKTKAKETK